MRFLKVEDPLDILVQDLDFEDDEFKNYLADKRTCNDLLNHCGDFNFLY